MADSGLLARSVHSVCSVGQMSASIAHSKHLGMPGCTPTLCGEAFPLGHRGRNMGGWLGQELLNCSVYVLTDDGPGAALSFTTWSACREFMARRVE